MDFARILRDRRASRRLSQLELALRAGTTQRHLSFLESGRSTPGREMVIRLGESLELPLRERNELLLAAGFAPAYPQTPLEAEALAPVMDALDHILAAHVFWSGVHGFTMLAIDRLMAPGVTVDDMIEKLLRTLIEGLRRA